MLSYILPTHNRPECLERTLQALSRLDPIDHEPIGGAEVIVIDNASSPRVQLSKTLDNGWPLRVIRLESNAGAAARNLGACEARGEWIVMLDDDSYPLDSNHVEVLLSAPRDVAAIGADIILASGQREAGGLPEVFIGCGVAIRRQAFLECGGYDHTFDYYVEEYDLSAKLLLAGWRIVHDHRFRVRHEKITANRDMNRILHRLVRNNCWVAQRYAPPEMLQREINENISRYARIAMKENAACGFAQGVADLLQTISSQPRRAMSRNLYDRFTGLAHVRHSLAASGLPLRGARIAIVDRGKNECAIEQALLEYQAIIVNQGAIADMLIIGSLSPGPMCDAFERQIARAQKPVICPWRPPHMGCAAEIAARAA